MCPQTLILCVHDDAAALAVAESLAAEPAIHLSAVALAIRASASNAPLYLPASIPISRESSWSFIQGSKGDAEPRRSLALIAETLDACEGQSCLLALSNWADIATLLLCQPALKSKIARLILVESQSDDPEALTILLESGVPISFVMAECYSAHTPEARSEADEKPTLAEALRMVLLGEQTFRAGERYVSVNRDGHSTRGHFLVDGLKLGAQAPNARVYYRYPFLV